MLILSEQDVDRVIKEKLVNGHQLKEWQKVLAESLIKFGRHAEYAPPRTVVTTDAASYLFMPYVDSSSPGTSDLLVGIKTLAGSTKYGFQGSVLVLDPSKGGAPTCLVNGKSLTPFRTALATTLSLERHAVHSPSSLCAFGAGLQIYWHIQLILLVRPSVKHVYIWNRTKSKGLELVNRLEKQHQEVKFEFVHQSPCEAVRQSQIIICATSSTEPLFKAEWLSPGTFIGLIGSYKPTMHEVGPDVMSRVKSRFVVDNVEAVLHEAGEFIDYKVSPTQMVEIGDILSGNQDDKDIQIEARSSFVVWKCVGLSVMDLCMSKAIQDAAIDLNIGVKVDF